MKTSTTSAPVRGRTPVPRGLATSGPPILSYGFRPFFLLAGIVAVLDMVLWVGALSGLWSIGGSAGSVNWHAHEMLFGYATAALSGFVLTAVPNWTGRLPVSGLPLLALVLIWGAGRICSLAPWLLGETTSAAVDGFFLFALSFVVALEVVVGKNWQNLRVAAGIAFLASLNTWFHLATLLGWDDQLAVRLTVSTYLMLVSHIGGRIVPSFTRNYLAKRHGKLPRIAGSIDNAALLATRLALLSWSVLPNWVGTAVPAAIAAVLQAVRLQGWRGWTVYAEPLLLVLHIGYAFLPLGLLGLALAATGRLSDPSALHVLTVGVIGTMTLAVMTRASRGHTGRPLRASPTTTVSYVCLFATVVLRPLAEAFPDGYHVILAVSGVAWILAFVAFLAEHAWMLLSPSLRKLS